MKRLVPLLAMPFAVVPISPARIVLLHTNSKLMKKIFPVLPCLITLTGTGR
jgi:hypothetical protein